jgi:hypothetical protein
MGPVKVKPGDPYIRRCPVQIDEYNLNISVAIDEFKKMMNEHMFPVVISSPIGTLSSFFT